METAAAVSRELSAVKWCNEQDREGCKWATVEWLYSGGSAGGGEKE